MKDFCRKPLVTYFWKVYATIGHLHYLLLVTDYFVLYGERKQSPLYEVLVKTWVDIWCPFTGQVKVMGSLGCCPPTRDGGLKVKVIGLINTKSKQAPNAYKLAKALNRPCQGMTCLQFAHCRVQAVLGSQYSSSVTYVMSCICNGLLAIVCSQ